MLLDFLRVNLTWVQVAQTEQKREHHQSELKWPPTRRAMKNTFFCFSFFVRSLSLCRRTDAPNGQ